MLIIVSIIALICCILRKQQKQIKDGVTYIRIDGRVTPGGIDFIANIIEIDNRDLADRHLNNLTGNGFTNSNREGLLRITNGF